MSDQTATQESEAGESASFRTLATTQTPGPDERPSGGESGVLADYKA